MANRRISTRRVKSRLTYTVAQTARIVDVHENTIRAWLAEGLETVGGNGRTLIFGAAIIEFVDSGALTGSARATSGRFIA